MKKRLMLHSGFEALRALEQESGRRAEREFALAPRFEMAPGQFVGAVWSPDAASSSLAWSGFRWGVAPPWWGDEHARHFLASARAESLGSKPVWAEALRRRRAVVPIDGFWLWHDVEGEERPFLVRSAHGEPLWAAALWQDGEVSRELALVTVEANRLVEPLSSRMPALLRGSDLTLWLDASVESEKPLRRVLRTPPVRGLMVTATDAEARGRASLRPSDDEREALSLVYGPRFDAEKPRFAPRRRCVLRDHEAGGHVFFRTRSFTRDDATRWHPVVDVEEGHVFCDCPDFQYRHERHNPDVWTPQWWCKHVRRAVENCRRHGELPLEPVGATLVEAT